jgi:4-amino-4-deoxy-L-arabinose transferase-like glycosyltransferase
MRQRASIFLVLLACSYVFFFLHLGSYSLKEPDEGRYAEIPREMVEQGDYLVPHLNYVRYFEKPPLLYWVTAASYKLLGVGEWSFRIPNALMALFCVLATYAFAVRRFGRKVAFVSSLILMSSFGFFAMARVVTTDMLFAFLLFASLLSFYQFYLEKRRLFLHLFSASLALAVLAKGPVALILLAVTILVFLFFEKRLSFLRELVSPIGLLLFIVIAAPWFIVMSIREKEFFDFFFVDQHILRFLTSKHKRSGPLYYFIPVLFGGLFPWSFFIPRAIARYWRKSELRLFFIWSCVVFIFFSVSGSKLPPYILPIYPALAILLGYLFCEVWGERPRGNGEIVAYVIFFAILAVLGFSFGTGLTDRYVAALPDVAALSTKVRGLAVSLGLLSVALLVLVTFRKGRTFRYLFYGLGAFSFLVVVGLMSYVHVIDGVNTTKELAAEINRRAPAAEVVNYRSFDETLPFYLGRRTYIAEYRGELEMGAGYSDATPFFINEDELKRLVESSQPMFVVMKEKRLFALGRLGLQEGGILARQDQRVLVANRVAAEQ